MSLHLLHGQVTSLCKHAKIKVFLSTSYSILLEGKLKKRTSVYLLIASLCFSISAPTSFAQSPRSTREAAGAASKHGNVDAITAARLKEYLYFIASDEMEGRDTPSRGLDLTAKFIAMNLSLAGVKPGGDNGTYMQKIALKRSKLDPKGTTAEVNGSPLTLGTDYTASVNAGVASGSMVFVGNGWYFPSKGLNSYQGIDVRDKIAVLLGNNLPKGITINDMRASKEGVDFEFPQGYLSKNGAKGIIMIAPAAANIAQFHQRSVERGSNWSVEKFASAATPLPSIQVSPDVANKIFEGETKSGADLLKSVLAGEPAESFALNASKQVKFNVAVASESAQTQNVVGILEGADPKLKSEYVAIGAHYDHVGIRTTPINGDAISNGADDDGSGTVAVLAIAEAFAKGPRPKRSLMFVWHAGEEKGLWGSRYVTDYPVVPMEQIVTQLNIDMIGRSRDANDTAPGNRELTGPNETYVIGSKMMSTELGELSEAVNKSYLNLTFNYKYDDPKDPNRFFFRSDHYNYARKGIPIIFYFSGVHVDYHQPSDSPEKIDYAKLEKIARTVMATAWELLNRPVRPKVDKHLPAELSAN